MLLLERSKRGGAEYREKRLCLIKTKLTKENRFSSKCREYFEQAETCISDEKKFDIAFTCLLSAIQPFDIAKFKKLLDDYQP